MDVNISSVARNNLATDFINQIDSDAQLFDHIYPNNCPQCNSLYYCIDGVRNLSQENTAYNFKLLNFNVRSFCANIDQLEGLLEASDVSFQTVILSESWINERNADMCELEGYTAYHQMRSEQLGGGVSVYCKSGISSEMVASMCVCNEEIETCTVKMETNGLTLLILGIYRPGGNIENFISQQENLLRDPICQNMTHIIVAGDFNIDIMTPELPNTLNFTNSMRSLQFLPAITRPTRFSNTEHSNSATCIDHIWTNSLSTFTSGII